MRIDIIGKGGYVVKEKLKDIIEKKVSKLEKFLTKNPSAKVICYQPAKNREKMEVTITNGGLFIRSEVESDNMYSNIDACLAKIERQIIKYSEKIVSKKRRDLVNDFEFNLFDEVPELEKSKITKRKTYELVPMTEDEAVEQMELIGNDFFIFLNGKTDAINLLYRRTDGDIGIIETKI